MALPNAIASSFAAAFMQRGAPFPLRGGAPIPPQFADGWPTVDGRTLSASFLDSASRQKAKQVRHDVGVDTSGGGAYMKPMQWFSANSAGKN